MKNPLIGSGSQLQFLKGQCWDLFFLIYINDLVNNIMSDAKLFVDDISVFNVVFDTDISAEILNQDLRAMKIGLISGK